MLVKYRHELRESARRFKQGSVNPRYDTSDIVQEGMVQIWTEMQHTGLEQFQANQTFLTRVSQGKACNLHRYHTAQRRSLRQESRITAEPACDRADPQRIAESQENLLRLLDAVSGLAPELKSVFCRRVFDRVTWREIAAEFNLSVDVVRRRYDSAKTLLRRRLQNETKDLESVA